MGMEGPRKETVPVVSGPVDNKEINIEKGPGNKKIGLSLSGCIKDILRGRTKEEDVLKIIAGTNANSPEVWKQVVDNYKKNVWAYAGTGEQEELMSQKGEEIFNRLLEAGKIEQPRLEGNQPPMGSGTWIEEDKFEEWKKEQNQIEIDRS